MAAERPVLLLERDQHAIGIDPAGCSRVVEQHQREEAHHLRLVGDQPVEGATEANRLAALLEHAQNEAMITGKPVAWSAQPGKYQFWQRGKEGKWDEPSGDDILRERSFPIAIEWGEIRVAGNSIKLNERLVFLAGGLNPPFEMKIKYRDRQLSIRGTATGRVTVDDKA